MAVKGIHHLGVAVEDLAGAAALYARLFGAELERREELPDQGVDVASLRVGDSHIELLSPLAADTPVGRFLAGRGPGMHHVAFGTTVAFVHPNAAGGVLAELVSDG